MQGQQEHERAAEPLPDNETTAHSDPSSGSGAADAAVPTENPGKFPEERFINRELSWLAFNERVLEEAANEAHPLFERVRFLSISDNNLNEFFAVRVAGLKNQVRAGISERSVDGLSPTQQLDAVNRRAADLMNEQQSSWVKLRKLLSKQGIDVVEPDGLRTNDHKWLTTFFMDQVYSVLTPVAIDPAHPFPFIPNFGFTIALMMEKYDGSDPMVGLISVPQGLPRFVRLPGRRIRLHHHGGRYLHVPGPPVPRHSHSVARRFQIIRDSDIEVEEEAEDLVLFYEAAIRKRRRGSAIRLTLDAGLPEEMREFLTANCRSICRMFFPFPNLFRWWT